MSEILLGHGRPEQPGGESIGNSTEQEPEVVAESSVVASNKSDLRSEPPAQPETVATQEESQQDNKTSQTAIKPKDEPTSPLEGGTWESKLQTFIDQLPI